MYVPVVWYEAIEKKCVGKEYINILIDRLISEEDRIGATAVLLMLTFDFGIQAPVLGVPNI